MCACPLGWKKTIALMTLKKKGVNKRSSYVLHGLQKKSYVLYKTKYGGIKFLKDDTNNEAY